jgi:transcriptional regulator with XRE-family HTH domain
MSEKQSPLAQLVRLRLRSLNMSQAALARKGGFNRAFISDLLRGAKSGVQDHNADLLAQALGLLREDIENPAVTLHRLQQAGASMEAYMSNSAMQSSLLTDRKAETVKRAHGGYRIEPLPETYDVPLPRFLVTSATHELTVFGASGPSHEGWHCIERARSFRIDVLGGLISRGAYAIRAQSVFEPTYQARELVLALPGLSPRLDDPVVIIARDQRADDEFWIVGGTLTEISVSGVGVSDFAQRNRIFCEWQDLFRMHRVVLSGDLQLLK